MHTGEAVEAKVNQNPIRIILFDWGDTLMSEDGPQDLPMADWPEIRLLDGAEEILEILSKNYRLGLATNAAVSKHSDITRALQRAGIERFFQEIFCYTEIGSRKDELAFWHKVLTRLNAKSNELIMIGDSLEQDVLGPQRVGIRAIWLNWKGSDGCGLNGVPIIRSLVEIPSALAKLLNDPVYGAR